MTKQEWQQKHGLTDIEMQLLAEIIFIFNGKITLIAESSKMPSKLKNNIVLDIRPGLVKGSYSGTTKSRSFYNGQWKRKTHV